VSLDESMYRISVLELFEGRFTNTEIDQMDVPLLQSRIDAKRELLRQREEDLASRNSRR
jgi:hypothetical protein